MFLKRWLFSLLFFSSFTVAAGETTVVPSEPATWYGDFQSLIVPTEECPGGTVEQLGKRMSVSESYSPQHPGAARRFSLSSLRGVVDSDRVHEFYFSSELPGDSFWGFGGYLVARGACVIHAKVTTIDN